MGLERHPPPPPRKPISPQPSNDEDGGDQVDGSTPDRPALMGLPRTGLSQCILVAVRVYYAVFQRVR